MTSNNMTTGLIFASLALLICAANAQTMVDNGKLDLTTTGSQYISNVSGSGTAGPIHCSVTTAVSGSPYVTFNVLVDGSLYYINSAMYSFSNNWGDLFNGALFSGAGKGSAVGDAFDIPMKISFSSSLKVYGAVNTAGSAGTLICNVYR
jgi:hypothetical protein